VVVIFKRRLLVFSPAAVELFFADVASGKKPSGSSFKMLDKDLNSRENPAARKILTMVNA
jgi:hypothetical protein